MVNSSEISWKRIGAEAIAIVASILLAFWIQAWWEGRQARIEEQAVLSELLNEFKELKENVEFSLKYNDGIRHSIRILTNAAVGPQNNLNDQEIDRLIADMYWNQSLGDWSAPVLSSIVASGDLNLISNLTLRRKLSRWPITLEGIRGVLQRDLDFYNNFQMPLLAELTSLAQINNAEDGQPGHPDYLYDGGRQIELKTEESHRDVLANRAFQNMLVQRDTYITDILEFYMRPLSESDEFDETITLLEQELSILADK